MLAAPPLLLSRALVHILCLIPFLYLLYAGWNNNLGANPIEYITRHTGDWTLRLILIVLAFRPVVHLSNMRWLLRHRRAVGLYTFFYASCHFVTYIWLDQFFDLQSIAVDILDRPFIFAGFGAFVLLIPLAITSNDRAVRYLQNHWTSLHRLVYVIAIAGLVHYWWLIRADYLKAWIYLSILALLLGYRLTYYIKQSYRYRV
ncbi:MAG: sulfoxide reductase heme-binding subunit YedZ [Chromatiales bacterium]|nr:sulfoxide reductase heme-binding subunit YedZ [Chromatiales bacterium]